MGDSITTDHISPTGAIALNTIAHQIASGRTVERNGTGRRYGTRVARLCEENEEKNGAAQHRQIVALTERSGLEDIEYFLGLGPH